MVGHLLIAGGARRPAQSSLECHAEPVESTSTEATALDAVDTTWQKRLAALPETMRTAVVLKHVVGLSYDEIALAVDRPAGTVKSDVHRGIDRLRTALTFEGALT